MKCIACNGSGLINSYLVCRTCSGFGHDGTPDLVVAIPQKPATKAKKVVAVVKKAVKKVSKK